MSSPTTLSQEEIAEVLETIGDHNHAYGFNFERAVMEKKAKKEAACSKRECPSVNSPVGLHEWVFPLAEDSIDLKRELAPIRCSFCFKELKPSIDLEKIFLRQRMGRR